MKKFLPILFILTTLWTLNSCKTQSYVKINKSYTQTWAAGIRNGGYGRIYTIKVVAKANSDELKFKQLIVPQAIIKIDPKNVKPEKWHKNDTLTISGKYTIFREKKPPKPNFPKNCNCKGILIYTYKNKEYKTFIKNFEEKRPIAYP